LIKPIILKDALLLEITFVLRLFKVLSAPRRVSASNNEKNVKKIQKKRKFRVATGIESTFFGF
jgi:hypothetical protein